MRTSYLELTVGAAKRIPRLEVFRVIALTVLMVVLWCNVYGMTSRTSWSTPRVYGSDAWWVLATIKAYRDGEITPFSFQMVNSLNAPFSANWNDYPTSEKMLPYGVGIMARCIGLMPAFNLAALLAVILAAIAFYIACRILTFQWMFAFVGAVMFGFSHYMSARILAHLSLTYYWHIPLYLLVTWWCFDSGDFPIRSARWWFAIAVGIVTGIQAIYYAMLFWQFLIFAIVTQGIRRNRAKLFSVISILVSSVGCTVLMGVPLVLYRILHGSNELVVQRSLTNLQVYALQLPPLFLPPFHRWAGFAEFSQARFFEVTLIGGEAESSYLGIIGIAGFVWLMSFGVYRLLEGRAHRIPVMFWQSVWIIVFSLAGGVNLLLGVSGLQLFRGTNRYSTVLLCLALLFLVKQLGERCPGRHHLFLAFIVLVVGLWDILPPPFTDGEGVRYSEKVVTPGAGYTKKRVAADRELVQRLERSLPAGAMVFLLPVMEFPEGLPHLGVGDYTYFRPYLYSRTLRFSYGSDKGRSLETWQHDVENLEPVAMFDKLEQYGFSALLIDRLGYSDAAASLLKDVESSGRKIIADDELGEFVAVRLQPSAHVVLPDIPPFPGPGFYGWEGDWRKGAHSWSKGNASLVLTNATGHATERRYTFGITSLSKRRVTVVTSKETKSVQVDPGKLAAVGPLALQLAPGETQVRFETDTPATPSGNSADPRRLAFSVALLPEAPQEPVPVLGPAFYGWEGEWQKGAHAWSRGSATLVIVNSTPKVIETQYTFLLNATSRRHVTVITPAGTKTVELNTSGPVTVGPFNLRLGTGETAIRFDTDRPAVIAGAGDTRTITFSLAIVPKP